MRSAPKRSVCAAGDLTRCHFFLYSSGPPNGCFCLLTATAAVCVRGVPLAWSNTSVGAPPPILLFDGIFRTLSLSLLDCDLGYAHDAGRRCCPRFTWLRIANKREREREHTSLEWEFPVIRFWCRSVVRRRYIHALKHVNTRFSSGLRRHTRDRI